MIAVDISNFTDPITPVAAQALKAASDSEGIEQGRPYARFGHPDRG